jgi:ubiquinone/menaquinone biosynthesis C-methylase UbiE
MFLARLYDRQLSLERPALEAALALLGVRPHERLLDVATGTGALLRELAVRSERPRHAVGLDASHAMLAGARGLPPGWELVRGDAGALPFEEASFDVATAVYLLHTLERGDRASVIAELARVLRPGGRLVVVTVDSPRPRLRSLLADAPRRSGLRPLDPRPELTGFSVCAARYVRRGYPSLCVLAEARQSASSPGASRASAAMARMSS